MASIAETIALKQAAELFFSDKFFCSFLKFVGEDQYVCITPKKCEAISGDALFLKSFIIFTCVMATDGFLQGQLTTSKPFIAKYTGVGWAIS